jgi:hypothetical protein
LIDDQAHDLVDAFQNSMHADVTAGGVSPGLH